MSACAWIYDDGGRAAAGYKGEAGDCVTRAIAIAAALPYQQVYDGLREQIAVTRLRRSTRGTRGNSPRDGVPKLVIRRYMERLGWRWTPTMQIGQGCTVHLRANELPSGRLVVAVSRHLCAVIHGVIWDTFDPSRDGTRCVYGYWRSPLSEEGR